MKQYKFYLLILFILIGIFFRLYNLNWGSPFYFHPDERNIASSVSQLNFPEQMNPHFFAYGSFPIYVIYFSGILLNLLSSVLYPANTANSQFSHVNFEQAVIVSRFYSAILSIILIGIIYRFGEILRSGFSGILAAILTSLSIGFIQFAHFGTFETWLTYCWTLLFLLLVKYLKHQNLKYFIAALAVSGLLISIKISSAVLFFPLLLIPIYILKKKNMLFSKKVFLYFPAYLLLSIIIVSSIWFITSPYNILDFSSFKNSINYESSVVLGTLPVFYTGGFYSSIPVFFQFTKIYPFLLNPIITLLIIPSLIYITYRGFKKRDPSYLLLTAFCFLLFFSQAMFFAKWTRNMVPTLPFVYLIISITIADILNKFKINFKSPSVYQYTSILVISFIVIVSLIFTASYFITAYLKKDTRVTANLWAKKNIPANSRILSEVYDLGIITFNPYFSNIKLFNFYDLENNTPESNMTVLTENLNNSDYLIIPSQRILEPRLSNPGKFPFGWQFYSKLFNGKLGFKLIYVTPCDIFCKIAYMDNPVFSYEETANVFDRPTVFIFKKIK